jgi:quinoprotein glucose dehydrogenase
VGLTSQAPGKIARLVVSLGLACIIVVCLARVALLGAATVEQAGVDWPAYGSQAAQDHYSRLSQTNREDVKKLKTAWTFDTGEKGSLETTPALRRPRIC